MSFPKNDGLQKRRAIPRAGLVLLAGVLLATLPAASYSQNELGVERLAKREDSGRTEVLLTHGINTDVPSLIAFLENGFPEQSLRRGLPENPKEKTTVANAAIQELGFRQAPEAAPFLLRIVQGEKTKGITDVITRDTETLPLVSKETASLYFQNVLRFNAMVALGLLGDPVVGEGLYAVLQAQQNYAFEIEGAVALGLLGDSRALEILSAQIDSSKSEELHIAFQAVFFLTGRNYDVSQTASLAKRREAVSQFQSWYKENNATWKPDREGILRRREVGMLISNPPMGTIRGALRATKEFGNYDVRYTGRTFLRNKGNGIWEEYKLISLDPLEELDIRVAAMEWYAASAPKEAKKDFKKLEEKDENPEIRKKAQSLLEDIQKMLDKKS